MTSSTTGVCTVSGGTISFIAVGTCTLTASATATTDYYAVTGSAQSFTVGQATPTISISNIPSSAVYGGGFTATYSYSGNGSPTESVTSTTTGVCMASGSTVTYVGSGTCSLHASATATTDYAAATGSTQSFTVTSITPTISISNIPSNAVYGSSFTATYNYSGNGSTSVSSSTTGVCTVSGSTVTLVGLGTCTLAAYASATTGYSAVSGSAQSFIVGQATPAISISNIPSNAAYNGSFTATYSYSGNDSPTKTVTSSTASVCTTSGNVVNFLNLGTCTLTAAATATTDYTAVTGSAQSFTVGQARPTITVSSSKNPSINNNTVTFTATISSGPVGILTFLDGSTQLGTAVLNGTTAIFMTSGLAVGSHSITASWAGSTDYASASSGVLTQTVNSGTTWDSGTVTLTVSNSSGAIFNKTASYSQGATPESVAADLTGSISSLNVTAVNDTLYLNATGTGASTDYYYTVASTWNSAFTNPSFEGSPASGSLTGGAAAGSSQPTIYSYAASYDGVGNVTGYTDSVMGTWIFTPDTLNRLTTGQATTAATATSGYANQYLCWSYDSFGNRTAQSLQSSACSSGVTATATYNSSNQVTWTTVNSAVNGFTYDAAGNVTSDNVNLYLYDGEGRICAVKSTPVAGFTTMTGYVYDAEGRRVAKGAIATWSCDPSVNGLVTAANVTDYILGSGGEQVTEMAQNASGNMEAQHVNVWAGGKLLATYDPNGLHFYLDDPLGSRRVQTDYAGVVEQNCASLPFGDGESCAPLPTEHLFTGKERDTESGNDYFGARYYSSAMGRWMSPDKPFADQHVANPQSWNLYSYTLNNPLRFVDQDGQIVVETRDTTYYSVSGATASEAMANANTHFSGEFGGMTNSHMDFTYQFSRTPSQNGDSSFTVKDTVTSDTITLKQTVDLPKWDGYDKASPEEQKAWDDSVGKLQSHETDHENINRAGADALDKALPGTSASATGKNLDPTAKAADNKLNKAVDAKADANAQATKQNNQHLDACTNHGTQGCK